jgi:1,4-alpha-glucan branching enzyme
VSDGVSAERPTERDLRLFAEGRHERLWEALGAHVGTHAGLAGARFSVWAPAAAEVSVVGPWNGWAPGADPLHRLDDRVWGGFVAGVGSGVPYKYSVTAADGSTSLRADPMAQYAEHSGGQSSVVFASAHEWGDAEWMATRHETLPVVDRMSAYEVHLGSWRRHADDRWLSYRELAPRLADYVGQLGFTHVELMPVAEHPFDPSWGYQVTGFYAPTSRYGDPDDFRWFVDHLHQRGIGVIVDWVPAHFPRDPGALIRFDGTALYEHDDPQRAEHPDWGTLEFDLGRPEVRSFLVANALYWLGELHLDGLRVDAVASMLYRDYSRGPDEWTPNVHGGNEDLEAVAFLQELNTVVHRVHPGVLTIAEESTAWDGVTRPAHLGGLGFTHKWNMGWMHDTLGYWSTESARRPSVHSKLTFGLTYAWAEHFVLPLSHDEVVHLKKPLLGKMPGATDEERFANLRALYAWMWAHPGSQLLFMGGELADTREWSHDRSLDWALLDDPRHAGVHDLLADLNALQAAHPALYEADADPAGFAWITSDDAGQSVLAFERGRPGDHDAVVVVANLQAQHHPHFRIGLHRSGPWHGLLSTDDARYAGAGATPGAVAAEPIPWQGRAHSAVVTLPPFTVVYLAPG